MAHSVNELEDHEAVVSLERDTDDSLRVASDSLWIIHATLGHLHHSEVQRLGCMADNASAYAQDRFEDVSRRAIEKAKGLSQ